MVSGRRSVQDPSTRWGPWWASVLTVAVLLVAAALGFYGLSLFYFFFAGAQYGIVGVPVGAVLLLVAVVMSVPAARYLRFRQHRTFLTMMILSGLIVALMGSLIFWASR